MSKIRKTYNLRKTSNIRQQQSVPQEQSRVSQFKEESDNAIRGSDVFDRNVSAISQNFKDQSKIIEEPQQHLVEGEELAINKLQLNFNVPLNDIEKQNIKIKNIGNSAVYVDFEFKNQPKINPHGFKDSKLKFYCHYQNTVIKPGQQTTFIFSFLSEFPGNFTEEVQIKCKPPLRTKIPNLKLNGTATIQDQWEAQRKTFVKRISEVDLTNQVRQILADVVNEVKIPPPAPPNVNDPKIAERQFQKLNSSQNLFYNSSLHPWFTELFNEICEKGGIPVEDRYWNQSVQSLSKMIQKSTYLDEVEKKCYKDRLQHYCYLSMAPLPNKSDLYETVFKFVSESAFALGGDFVDTARKELDMWEVPFREPLITDTPEEEKARKEEIEKIKAEWVKKAKKKKWGEQQEKQMVKEFKKKVQSLTTEYLLKKFDNFEESAEFIKTRQFIKKSQFKLGNYHSYLERMKTVRQCPLDGKKVLIKWHLKLKDNCDEQLKQLQEYLNKKKEMEKRLEDEKKDGGKKKKTVVNKNKKKGQKEEEQEKPLVFDFMSILDEENWNGFLETFRVVMEKQPFMVLIGVTYGPRAGRHIPQYSVHFLLQHLKTLESTIEFFPHENLSSLSQKLQNQSINEGSIFLMQNLNFLPWQTCQEETVELIAEEGKQQKFEKISKRKLLQPEIRQFFDNFGQCVDVLVNEDRYLNQLSGFTSYLNKEVLMGTQWWKYVGLSTRVIDSTIIFGQDFTPDNYLLLSRLIPVVKNIYLAGRIGLKFYLVKNKMEKLGSIVLGSSQKQSIKDILTTLEESKQEHKIIIPVDFSLFKKNQDSIDTLQFNGSQTEINGFEVSDIGTKTIEKINNINKGHLFVLGDTSITQSEGKLSDSLAKLVKNFYKKEEIKKQRHAQQSSTPAGIDYSEDIVIYLIGIGEQLIEKADLKEKKVKKSQEQDEEGEEEQQEGESDKKKVDLVSDFRLNSLSGLVRLWSGRFDAGLRDITKYPLIQDD